MAVDVIEIWLPPKPEYIPVIRAAVGVIAGGMAFNYDEIIHLRVAVAEAFDLGARCLARGAPSEASFLEVRFTVQPDRLEVDIPSPPGRSPCAGTEDEESRALLESLVDTVELGTGGAEGPLVHLVKYRKAPGDT